MRGPADKACVVEAPEVRLANIMRPACYGSSLPISPAILRQIIRERWSEVSALAHQIHDEKEPADAIDGLIVYGPQKAKRCPDEKGALTEVGVRLTRDSWSDIERILGAAGFKVVRS